VKPWLKAVPVLVPALPLQFVHEQDLVAAFLLGIVAAGPPWAYDVAADGILTMADVAREFGMVPVPLPAGPARLAARAIAALPFLPSAAQWAWAPRFTAAGALRDTVQRGW
jgi:nucleoside-diphosphate-sugar epimerase